MATLIFTVLGTALGGPVGGALGAMLGSQLDTSIFGARSRQGARLKDLSVTTSTYGAALPRHYGRMRVGGTIIWSTDLVEHSSTNSTGKGKPSLTTYSYTSSFAVALASRPIARLGRIWADGKLLRGAAGDLKVGGAIRFYSGGHDQLPDPLIAAAEGGDMCPAFRGLSYVVFEDLQLADFGNRIPSLNFELLDDEEPLSVQRLFDGVVQDVVADVALDDLVGFSCDSSLAEALQQFDNLRPMLCNASGDGLEIVDSFKSGAVLALGHAAIEVSGKGKSGQLGYSRQRSPVPESPLQVLRYYDVDLDYQVGTQRTTGRALSGQPRSLDLPAAMRSDAAFKLVAQAARGDSWRRDSISWRCAEFDPAVGPGALVSLPDFAGVWRVLEWEWRESGVELSLERCPPQVEHVTISTQSGMANLAADLWVAPTSLVALELPMGTADIVDGTGLYAAVSSVGAGWKGAALFADKGDGQLASLGGSGRLRATIGKAVSELPAAPSTHFDSGNNVLVELLSDDMVLSSVSLENLVQGGNRALLGEEIIQFAYAEHVEGRVWRLSCLLRGLGGTEFALSSHARDEAFVLLDDRLVQLDASLMGTVATAKVGAMGLADTTLVEASIINQGLHKRPLAPVHGRKIKAADGSLQLLWTRRARGAWSWPDGVEVPLQEQGELYWVAYGSPTMPTATWQVSSPTLTLSAAQWAALQSDLADGEFWVSQIGTYAQSLPLMLV
jgi:hypothetical protein